MKTALIAILLAAAALSVGSQTVKSPNIDAIMAGDGESTEVAIKWNDSDPAVKSADIVIIRVAYTDDRGDLKDLTFARDTVMPLTKDVFLGADPIPVPMNRVKWVDVQVLQTLRHYTIQGQFIERKEP